MAKPPKEDLISFDVSNPVTLDREKHVLKELLASTSKQLPPMNRDQLFSELVQRTKVEKLMSYKPKHKEFENPENEITDEMCPPKMFRSYAYKA